MRTRFEEGAVSESGVLRLGGIGGACSGGWWVLGGVVMLGVMGS